MIVLRGSAHKRGATALMEHMQDPSKSSRGPFPNATVAPTTLLFILGPFVPLFISHIVALPGKVIVNSRPMSLLVSEQAETFQIGI